MLRLFFTTALLTLSGLQARACELALVLAVDVSGSVSADEYRIQMQGLAAALRDGVVSEALVEADARVMLVQWTGDSRQEVSLPWYRIGSFAAADAFARSVEVAPRAWRHFSTAIGEALAVSLTQFTDVPDCRRRVIDVSGDGRSNEGRLPSTMKPALSAAKVTVNALVIEGAEGDLTGYFWENVIWGDGAFAVTANGFNDYPARIREKLLREVAEAMARAPLDPEATQRAGFNPR